jgi:DNA polymerase-3 subunit epsilon
VSGEDGFVALDLETTGLDRRAAAIVSAAVVPFVGGVPRRPLIDSFVNPGRPIPPASQAIHGITDATVRDSPPASAIVRKIVEACSGRVVVGHSTGFDLSIIDREARAAGLPRLSGPTLDVGRLAAALHPGWGCLSLEQLCRRLGVPVIGRHTAAGDAVTAGAVFLKLLPRMDALGLSSIGDLLRIQR